MKQRYLQAHKEARISIYLTFFYLFFWIVFSYFVDVESVFMGFPLWFMLACIITPIVFFALCYGVIKLTFKDIPLDIKSSDKLSNK